MNRPYPGRLGVKQSRLPLADREEAGMVGWKNSELAKPWNPPLRIVKLEVPHRTMPPGWAKVVCAQLRKMPIFEDETERNIFRRWKQRRITTSQFKDLVKAHVKKRLEAKSA